MTMKKLNLKTVLVCLSLLFTVNAQAQLGNLLKNVLGSGTANSEQAETTTENKVGGLVSLFQNLIGKDKVDNSSLKGEWIYESPAVAFESSNLLNKPFFMAAEYLALKSIFCQTLVGTSRLNKSVKM